MFSHGYIERREEPLSEQSLSELYSQTPRANFSHYTYPHYRDHGHHSQAPIVWFVSHCNAHSGRWGRRQSGRWSHRKYFQGQIHFLAQESVYCHIITDNFYFKTFSTSLKPGLWWYYLTFSDRKWIGVDIYGRCGEKQCGDVRNIQHEYSTNTDPCFHLVNRNYRSANRWLLSLFSSQWACQHNIDIMNYLTIQQLCMYVM